VNHVNESIRMGGLLLSERHCPGPGAGLPPEQGIQGKQGIDVAHARTSKTGRAKGQSHRFVKPTVDEVQSYCTERGNWIDPEHFCDYNEARGWKVSNSPMKDWRAAVRTWEKRDTRSSDNAAPPAIDLSHYATPSDLDSNYISGARK